MLKMRKIAEAVLDALFPPRCPVCGELPAEEGRQICAACFSRLDFVKEPRCLRCGKTVFDETVGLCADCEKRERSFERGFALLNYDDCMRRMVAEIKYKNRRSYLKPMARLLYLAYREQIADMRADCLAPVPLHPSRLRSRGFNQAELLAREIGRHAGIPVRADLLIRVKKTAAQNALNPEERARNLERAFAVRRPDPKLRRVILVDDIFTTGSTVEACAQALRAAGADEIFFLCLCIVPEF